MAKAKANLRAVVRPCALFSLLYAVLPVPISDPFRALPSLARYPWSQDAENKIKIQRARADADAITIAAEAQKNKQIIEAKGLAEARTIEAKARNDAAAMMTDDFARALQLAGQQVEFAKSLKAKVLTVLPDRSVARWLGCVPSADRSPPRSPACPCSALWASLW